MRTALALTLVLLLAAPASAQTAEDWQRLGEMAAAAGAADMAGDDAAAIATLTEILDLLGTFETESSAVWVDGYLARARLYLAGGDFARGLADTSAAWQIAEGHPDLPRPQLLYDLHARALMTSGDRAGAATVLEEGIATMPDPLPLVLLLADAELLERRSDDLSALLAQWGPALDASPHAAAAAVVAGRHAIQAGDFAAAESRLEDALGLTAETPDAAERAGALYALGDLAVLTGDMAEAESRFLQAQAATEARGGTSLPVGLITHARALIRAEIGDVDAARRFFAEAEAELTRSLGPVHPAVLATRTERVHLNLREGETARAVTEARAVVADFEAGDRTDAYEYRLAIAALGLALAADGQGAEATARLVSVQDGGTLPLLDQDRPPGLIALGRMALAAGDPAGAEMRLAEAARVLRRFPQFGIDRLGETQRLLVRALVAQGRGAEARALAEANMAAATEAILGRPAAPVLSARVQPLSLRPILEQVIGFRMEDGDPEAIFAAMQVLHLDELGLSLDPGSFGLHADGPTADLMAERSAVLKRLARLERALTGAGTRPEGAARAELIAGLIEADGELDALNARIAADGGIRRTLVTLADVQATLEPGEGFWSHAVFDGFGVGLLVTRDTARTAMLPGAETLDPQIAALRAGVTLTDGATEYPVFDMAASADAFDSLFGPFAEDVAGLRRLVTMPDGAARRMSLAVLSAPSETGRSFLGTTHALVVAPSADGFLALRAGAADADLSGGFLGVAQALLAERPEPGQGPLYDAATGLGRPQAIRAGLAYLADTGTEMRLVSEQLGADRTRVLAGEAATETALRQADFGGVATVSFATHALLAGEGGLPEPAIVLTPPETATEEDDGLLLASEVALLDMPVHLVVLSACNTGAAGRRIGAGGLSGLAAAFFQAGARSVMATHWSIDSGPSAFAVAQFVSSSMSGTGTPPSEVLRQIMAALSQHGDPRISHPATWGAFTILGES